jgi:hypothetical protein
MCVNNVMPRNLHENRGTAQNTLHGELKINCSVLLNTRVSGPLRGRSTFLSDAVKTYNLQSTPQDEVAVTFWNCIWELPTSNLDRFSSCLVFRTVSSVFSGELTTSPRDQQCAGSEMTFLT